MTSVDNKQIVADAYAAMQGGDVPAFLAVLDEGIVVHEPDFLPYGGTANGREAFVRLLPKAAALLDISRLVVDELIAEGDSVVALFRIGLAGSNAEARLAERWLMRDGKAVELRVFWFDPPVLEG